MALANSTLSNTSGSKGDVIKTSVYTDLNKLLANDKAMDTRLTTCQTNAATAYNKVKGS